jgi:hypothetical protein
MASMQNRLLAILPAMVATRGLNYELSAAQTSAAFKRSGNIEGWFCWLHPSSLLITFAVRCGL